MANVQKMAVNVLLAGGARIVVSLVHLENMGKIVIKSVSVKTTPPVTLLAATVHVPPDTLAMPAKTAVLMVTMAIVVSIYVCAPQTADVIM